MRPIGAHAALGTLALLVLLSSVPPHAPLAAQQVAECPEPPASGPDIHAAEAWNDWGEDLRNLRAKGPEATAVTGEEVPRLELEWAYAVPGVGMMRSQPAVAGDWLYLAGTDGTVRALHAKRGCVLWETPLDAPLRSGVALAEPGTDGVVLFVGDAAGDVHALSAETGEVRWSESVDDHPAALVSGTPRAHDGTLYVPVSSAESALDFAPDPEYECCTFRGKVVALDATTGEEMWEYYTIEERPEERDHNEAGTTMWGPSGAAVWSTITVDVERGRLYVGTSNNYSEPATETSSAVHAIDMETGERAWVFQGTEDDTWNAACIEIGVMPGLERISMGQSEFHGSANCPEDPGPDFDFGTAPMLVPLSDGRDVIVAGQKSGVVHGLDPDRSGEPVWETRVGRGGLVGGVHFGMAAREGLVAVPVSDRDVGVAYEREPRPGVVGLDAATGEIRWSTPALEGVCEHRARCFPGFSAPATLVPGAVLAGSLDGHLQAFSARDGERIWSFDTARPFETVNDAVGYGGAMSAAGPVVAGDRVYVVSGYDFFEQMPGNVLLAFSVQR